MIGFRIVSEDCFEVQKLAVARQYRRHGVSNQLWNKMENEAFHLCPKRLVDTSLLFNRSFTYMLINNISSGSG